MDMIEKRQSFKNLAIPYIDYYMLHYERVFDKLEVKVIEERVAKFLQTADWLNFSKFTAHIFDVE